MKVFIKILGLIGLINCIVLYGADRRGADGASIETGLLLKQERQQSGSGGSVPKIRSQESKSPKTVLVVAPWVFPSTTHVGSVAVIDGPSSEVRRDSQEGRGSTDRLIGSFAKQYADTPRQPETAFDKLINGFKDPQNAHFARECIKKRTPDALQRLNALVIASASPRHRTRLMPTDWLDDQQGQQQGNTTNKQGALLEAWTAVMKEELALKEKMHKEDAAEAQRQFEASSLQKSSLRADLTAFQLLQL